MTDLELKYMTVAVRDLPRIASALERIAAVVERAADGDNDLDKRRERGREAR